MPASSHARISPDYPNHLSDVPCPLPRRIKRVRVSIASPLIQPSPNGRRVGIRIVTFEACSGFTHVTAHRVAQPPKAAFVTRLQPFRSPGRAARQLPDQSTTLWVDSSSTGDSRLRGALPKPDLETRPRWAWSAASAVWLGWGKIKATIAHESHPFCAESHYFCGESHELWESHFLLCFANGDTHLRGQVLAGKTVGETWNMACSYTFAMTKS